MLSNCANSFPLLILLITKEFRFVGPLSQMRYSRFDFVYHLTALIRVAFTLIYGSRNARLSSIYQRERIGV